MNNRYYIGSTSHYNIRKRNHYHTIKSTLKQHNELHKDIKKYGESFFTMEIIMENEDKIKISRAESKMIRERKNDPLCYNKTIGASGRRVFYESDIIFIRELYNEKNLYITEAYDLYYKNIVSFRAFKKVWHGDTFKDIHYDVYTEENKAWHFSKGQSRPGEKNGRSILTVKDVKYIRRCKRFGIDKFKLYEKRYKDIVKYATFNEVWNNKKWKHVK